MKTRNFVLCALGLAAAVTTGNATIASAQATSQRRIPVRKEEPAVAPKTDTVRVVRVDTVTIRGRTDTVVRTVERLRVDTVMETLPLHRLPGTYFGLGAGVAIPMNHFRNYIHDGLDLNGQIGWFPQGGAFGLRADVNWANFAHRKTDCLGCPDTKLLSGMADVVLRFPLDQKSSLNPVIYILGGGGIDKFSDFIPYINTEGAVVTAGSNTYLGTPPGLATAATAGTSSTFWDYHAGAGLDFDAGPAHLFVEGRYATINTNGGNTHYWPVIVGLKFY